DVLPPILGFFEVKFWVFLGQILPFLGFFGSNFGVLGVRNWDFFRSNFFFFGSNFGFFWVNFCSFHLKISLFLTQIFFSLSQPPPPSPPPSPPPADFGVNSPDFGILAEPRLEELGLGASTPVGMIQNLLEFLHLELGLPWWASIATGTVGARILLLPLVLRGQREAARLSRHLPHLQRLSQRVSEARRGTDPNQVAVAYSELVAYQRRHDVNPLRGFLTPLFVSFFLALQGMAAAPVPGLLRGGLAWFPNLAAPDPLYALPLLVTRLHLARLGAETGVAAPGAGPMRQILRLLPLVFLPFIIHFPTAVFTYWLTSNCFSLLQTGLLRVPALRTDFGAPQTPPEWREAQATHEAEQRRWRLKNHLNLAAKGPLRQTFAQNPLSPPGTRPAPPSESPKRPWKDTLG
uniref:OXA1L mitochondrial inner membrane protein n=1 Tax=Catharus ustulatus TaxID=91951 RepID=A0A8C3V0A4_CATUS